MTVLSIVGTRPEAVKMAPIILELGARSDVKSLVCATGQHRHLLDQVMTTFGIKADYDLNVMKPGQSPTAVAAAVLDRLDPILGTTAPDWVLVQGDTTTVMAAAIAAFYRRVRVGHVEAGLRTFDRQQPFPEEVNRRIATAVADAHFAPTERARANLLREGVPDETIRVTGNSVIDALRLLSSVPYDPAAGPLAGIPWNKRLILVTAHRRESFGRPIEEVCLALRDIAERGRQTLHIVYPVHPNPNIMEPVQRILGGLDNVSLVEPLDYLPFVYLMKQSTLILTDSGGIQEEAPGLGKPVLVLREVTERQEAVDAGTVRLVGTSRETITRWTERLLGSPAEYEKMARSVNPYGDGHAAPRIVDFIMGVEKS